MKPQSIVICLLPSIRQPDKPLEDVAQVGRSKCTFALADGITQDRLPNGAYPKPSGATIAARLFCQNVIRTLEQRREVTVQNPIRLAFDAANQSILELNERRQFRERLNYLDYDLYGTVGAAACVIDNRLYYGHVGDCGLLLIGSDGRVKLRKVDDLSDVRAYVQTKKEKGDFSSVSEERVFVRKMLRNNPSFSEHPWENVTYGAFTGESTVQYYYRLGDIEIQHGDTLLLYTDGIEPFLAVAEFLGHLHNKVHLNKSERLEILLKCWASNDPEQFGDDRGLILVNW